SRARARLDSGRGLRRLAGAVELLHRSRRARFQRGGRGVHLRRRAALRQGLAVRVRDRFLGRRRDRGIRPAGPRDGGRKARDASGPLGGRADRGSGNRDARSVFDRRSADASADRAGADHERENAALSGSRRKDRDPERNGLLRAVAARAARRRSRRAPRRGGAASRALLEARRRRRGVHLSEGHRNRPEAGPDASHELRAPRPNAPGDRDDVHGAHDGFPLRGHRADARARRVPRSGSPAARDAGGEPGSGRPFRAGPDRARGPLDEGVARGGSDLKEDSMAKTRRALLQAAGAISALAALPLPAQTPAPTPTPGPEKKPGPLAKLARERFGKFLKPEELALMDEDMAFVE